MNWVMFGHSHFFGDIFDLIQDNNGTLSKVVLNAGELQTPGRPTMKERLNRLPLPVEIVHLDDWKAGYDERYVIGFTGKKMEPLVTDLKSRFKIWFFDALIHSRAIIQCGVTVSGGTMVDAGAIIGSWAKIGKHVILNRGSNVGHDCEIGDYSFVAPGATLCGHVKLGEGAYIGANATVIQDIKIGAGSVVAAGAVVTHDVPDGVMVAGVPAMYKKKV